jgi:hypothetical protein
LSATPAATGNANACRRLAFDSGPRVLVGADAPQPVQEGAQAFAEIRVVDRGGKDCGVRRADLVQNHGKIVFNNAAALLAAQTPAIVVTLAAAFHPERRKENGLHESAAVLDAAPDRFDGASYLSGGVTAA